MHIGVNTWSVCQWWVCVRVTLLTWNINGLNWLNAAVWYYLPTGDLFLLSRDCDVCCRPINLPIGHC